MAKGIAAIDPASPRWYAVRTRFKWEKKVATAFEEQRIEHYLPLYEQFKKYEKVVKRTMLPLIPHYIFVRIVQTEYITVLQQNGVQGFLHNHGHLHFIPDEEIAALRYFAVDVENVEVIEGVWESGTPVMIMEGPLAGHAAKVVEELGKHKIVVTLEGLKYSFKMVVDKNTLYKEK